MRYPPMPWRLVPRGVTVVTLHWVRVENARRFVSPDYRILQFWPGWTIGGLLVAEYGPGSALEYNEIIVCGATVLYRGRPAAWATHVYVDNPDSVRGGRETIGVPKYLASFRHMGTDPHLIEIAAEGEPICRISFGRQLWLWRQRARLAALHLDVRDVSRSTVSVHGNEVRGRIGLTRAQVEIPEGSPLSVLDLGRPIMSFCASDVELVLGGASFLPHHVVSATPPPAEAPLSTTR